ncbi:hypothetical protein AJ90_19485 [Vibrio parahaemolyticus M0605]|nr:hypothetical protein AJ90_19485 [Vibrio parahaemolyticus M0605]
MALFLFGLGVNVNKKVNGDDNRRESDKAFNVARIKLARHMRVINQN